MTLKIPVNLLKRFVLIAIVCALAGTMWHLRERAETTQRTVEWLAAQNLGLARFDWQDCSRGYTPLDDGLHEVNWFRRSYGGIEDVTIMDSSLTDLAPISHADTIRSASITTQQELNLEPLANLRHLEQLSITAKRLDSLVPLIALPNLKWLLIVDTEISNDALARFQSARPDVQFQHTNSTEDQAEQNHGRSDAAK